MTVQEALEAVEWAESVISGCEGIDELDEASDRERARRNCPVHFNYEMQNLVQELIMKAYLQAIGRA